MVRPRAVLAAEELPSVVADVAVLVIAVVGPSDLLKLEALALLLHQRLQGGVGAGALVAAQVVLEDVAHVLVRHVPGDEA